MLIGPFFFLCLQLVLRNVRFISSAHSLGYYQMNKMHRKEVAEIISRRIPDRRFQNNLIYCIEHIPRLILSLFPPSSSQPPTPLCAHVLAFFLARRSSMRLEGNEVYWRQSITSLVYSVYSLMIQELDRIISPDCRYEEYYYIMKEASKVIDWPFSIQCMIEKKNIPRDENKGNMKMQMLCLLEVLLHFLENNPQQIEIQDPSGLISIFNDVLPLVQCSCSFAMLLRFVKALKHTKFFPSLANLFIQTILSAMKDKQYCFWWRYLQLIEAMISGAIVDSSTLKELGTVFNTLKDDLEPFQMPKYSYVSLHF